MSQDANSHPAQSALVQWDDATMRSLLESLPSAAYTCDSSGLITGFNQRAVDLWGRTPKLNHPDDRYCGSFKLLSADGTRIQHDQCWMALAVERNEAYNGVKIIIERPNGERRVALAHATPLRNSSGEVVAAINILVDMSDQRAANRAVAHLAAIVESSHDAIVSKTLDGIVTSWNHGAEQLFGYPADEAVGRSITFLLPPDRVDEERVIISRLRNGERIDHFETKRVTRDGRLIDVSLTISPIRDDRGTIIGASKIARDITERKAAEAALKRLNESLETQVQARTAELQQRADQLAHLASQLTLAEHRERRRLAQVLHDHLQQLLVAVKLGLERLSRRLPTEQHRSVEDIQGLVSESIHASRSLTVELSPPILHEAGLAVGLEWLARWMEKKHGLTIELRLDPSVEVSREDVRLLIFEAVRELLFNTIKHAGVTEACIELAQHNEHQLRATVTDRGVGFDPDAAGAASTMLGGFGLFSIRERLDLLGGQFIIDSAPRQGTRITLLAPVRHEQASTAEADAPPTNSGCDRAETPAPSADAPREPRRIRLLIADDHVVMRQGLSALLAEEPTIEVVGEATDGAETIALARELMPDVILMDYSMPEMDGIKATRTINAELPQIRIIGLSMYEEADRSRAMQEAGAVAYATKSGEFRALMATIHKAFECVAIA